MRKQTPTTPASEKEKGHGKRLPVFAPTRPEDVAGSLRYKGRPKTIEEMHAGIVVEARRRYGKKFSKG